jgi:hypothetical protein
MQGLPVHHRDVGTLYLITECARCSSFAAKYLLLPGHDDVTGLGTVHGVLESVFGPLGVQPFASQIYGHATERDKAIN